MFHRIFKWVLWLTGLLFTILILVATGLFFTPNMVSTNWFRHQFETRASNALKRQVTVKDLQWTWKEGIKIEGLETIDAPEYAQGPILSVDHILFSFDFQPTRKRLFIDLEVDGLRAHLIREKDGRTNLAAWLSQLKPPRETTEPAPDAPRESRPTTPFILPGDLEAKVQLSHAHIRVDDRMENRSLHIQDGTFKLEIPSLLSKPVTLVLSSRQEMDGKMLPPLALTVHVDQLVDETHALNPQAAILQVNGEFPGLNVAVKGSLAQRGLEGRVAIDFIPLVKTVQAFLPNIVPQLSGRVLLQAKARSEKENTIAFDLVLSGEDILAAGGPLKEKQVGPLSFNISQKGSADLNVKAVTLAGGEIRFMEHCGLFWEGHVKMEGKKGADVNLILSRVKLDLNEIQRLPKGFIPKDVHMTGLNNADRPDFGIDEIHLTGILPKGEARLSIKDLVLNVSNLGMALSEKNLKVEDLTLQIPDAAVQLKNLFPKVLEMRAELGAKNIRVSGKQSFFLEEGLTLKGHVKDVRLNQLAPLMLDVGGLEADIQSGDLLSLHLKGAAVDSGMNIQMEGRLGVDLKQVLDLAPADLKPKGDFTGRLETQWRLQGRRPDAKELVGLADNGLPLEKRLQQMAFLEELNLKTRFINMGITLPPKSGETLSVLGIHSPNPFEISLLDGMKSVLFEGKINLDKIQALPTLGKLKPPQSAVFSVKGVGRDFNSLELWESFSVPPLAMEQTLELSLNKLNHLLRKKEKPDLTAILKLLEAKVQAGVSVNMGTELAPFSKGLTLEGPLKGRLELKLRGGKTISAQTFLESEGLNVTLGPKLTLNHLKTHLQLEKTYDLAFGPPIVSRENTKALSRRVLEPGITSRPDLGFNNSLSQRLVEDLRGRLSRNPTLSFDSAWVASGPFPMEINNAQLQMRLNPSLPSVDYFQMDIMGGTLLGELGIYERRDLYFFHMDGAFSGLDVETRRAETGRGSEGLPNQRQKGEDTRISGRVSLEIPISPNTRTVMNNTDAVFRLTHIGPRTLERLLYAMDPHENNESIVKQRALLRKGTPRWIEVAIRHGNLSLTGEVTVGGSSIHLPPIKRLNVTALPIQKRIQNLADAMVPLVKGLKILSADTLRVDQGGGIDFTEASR